MVSVALITTTPSVEVPVLTAAIPRLGPAVIQSMFGIQLSINLPSSLLRLQVDSLLTERPLAQGGLRGWQMLRGEVQG